MERARTVDTSRFERDGFVILRSVIDGALCDEVRDALAPRAQRLQRPGARLQDAWRSYPPVRDVATDPDVLGSLTQLYERRPIPFQTLNFACGTQQRLHADAVHFDTIPHGWVCGVWVALEDVGAEQGPLVVVPGSHREPVTVEQVFDVAGSFDMGCYEDLVAAGVGGGDVQVIHLDRGDAIVWSADLVHGGAPVSRPGVTRWSQVTHYVFDGCTYVTPMLGDPRVGELHLRDPLIDLTDGRVVPHLIAGGRPQFHHVPGGRSKLVDFDDPPLPRFELGRSMVRGGARRTRRNAGVLARRILDSTQRLRRPSQPLGGGRPGGQG